MPTSFNELIDIIKGFEMAMNQYGQHGLAREMAVTREMEPMLRAALSCRGWSGKRLPRKILGITMVYNSPYFELRIKRGQV